MLDRFGGRQSVTVVADVSGPHDGTAEVRRLAEGLLSQFGGVADDELSARLWPLSTNFVRSQVRT